MRKYPYFRKIRPTITTSDLVSSVITKNTNNNEKITSSISIKSPVFLVLIILQRSYNSIFHRNATLMHGDIEQTISQMK